jgi:hypothetical protein
MAIRLSINEYHSVQSTYREQDEHEQAVDGEYRSRNPTVSSIRAPAAPFIIGISPDAKGRKRLFACAAIGFQIEEIVDDVGAEAHKPKPHKREHGTGNHGGIRCFVRRAAQERRSADS